MNKVVNDVVNDLEKAILGFFLLEDKFHLYSDQLSISTFECGFHQRIYMAMVHLAEDKISIDPLTVSSRLKLLFETVYDHNSDSCYLYEIANACPSRLNTQSYINELSLHKESKE